MPGWCEAERMKRSGHYSMALNHFHDHYEIYYLLSGERFYFIQDRTHLVNRGELVLVNKRLLHKTISTGMPDHERILVSFDDAFLGTVDVDGPSLTGIFQSDSPLLRFHPQDQSLVETILIRMVQEFHSTNVHRFTYLRALLVQLLIQCTRAEQKVGQIEQLPSIHQKIREVIAWIADSYAEPLTLTSVADKFGFSPAYMSRSFKQATGFTFVEYMSNIRVKEAQRLLRETNMKVIHIAEETGFQNVAHFGRVFKQISRCPPLEYRKMKSPSVHPESSHC